MTTEQEPLPFKVQQIIDRNQFEATCGRKRAYTDPVLAEREAARLQSVKPGEYFTTYGCPYCTLWHVGHFRTPEERAIRKQEAVEQVMAEVQRQQQQQLPRLTPSTEDVKAFLILNNNKYDRAAEIAGIHSIHAIKQALHGELPPGLQASLLITAIDARRREIELIKEQRRARMTAEGSAPSLAQQEPQGLMKPLAPMPDLTTITHLDDTGRIINVTREPEQEQEQEPMKKITDKIVLCGKCGKPYPQTLEHFSLFGPKSRRRWNSWCRSCWAEQGKINLQKASAVRHQHTAERGAAKVEAAAAAKIAKAEAALTEAKMAKPDPRPWVPSPVMSAPVPAPATVPIVKGTAIAVRMTDIAVEIEALEREIVSVLNENLRLAQQNQLLRRDLEQWNNMKKYLRDMETGGVK